MHARNTAYDLQKPPMPSLQDCCAQECDPKASRQLAVTSAFSKLLTSLECLEHQLSDLWPRLSSVQRNEPRKDTGECKTKPVDSCPLAESILSIGERINRLASDVSDNRSILEI